jgi:hypothetical protein
LNKNLEVREKTMARLLADGKTYQLKHEKEKNDKKNFGLETILVSLTYGEGIYRKEGRS